MKTNVVVKVATYIVLVFLFVSSYFFIVSRTIDLPFDSDILAYQLPIYWNTNMDSKWKNCTPFEDTPEFRDFSLEDQEILKGVCILHVNFKDGRVFAGFLNINNTALQRQVCVMGDGEFVPEQERKDGTSVWDIRNFGKLSKDGKCLYLNPKLDEIDINSDIELPIRVFPGLTMHYLERSLVHGWNAIFAVYSLSFIFTFVIWKYLFDIIFFSIKFFGNENKLENS